MIVPMLGAPRYAQAGLDTDRAYAPRGYAARDALRHKWHRLRGSEPGGCFKSRLRPSLPPCKLVFNLAVLFLEGLGVLLLFAVGGRGDDLVDAFGR